MCINEMDRNRFPARMRLQTYTSHRSSKIFSRGWTTASVSVLPTTRHQAAALASTYTCKIAKLLARSVTDSNSGSPQADAAMRAHKPDSVPWRGKTPEEKWVLSARACKTPDRKPAATQQASGTRPATVLPVCQQASHQQEEEKGERLPQRSEPSFVWESWCQAATETAGDAAH
jgi:hypothetical protein